MQTTCMKLLSHFIAIFSSFFLLFSCAKDCPAPPSAANLEDSVKMGLWGYYNFNGGNVSDLTGRSHHLRVVNGLQFGVDKLGSANNALLFDGVNDYAVIDSGIHFPEGNFAVSFFINAQKTSGGRIFNKANFNNGRSPSINFGFDDDNATNKLNFAISNNNNICNNFWSPASATNLYTNTLINSNAWYAVVAQHTNGIMKVYLNSVLIAAISTPNNSFKACSDAPFYFGIWWLSDLLPYKGSMDNIRIYTRSLSDGEIKYLSENYK